MLVSLILEVPTSINKLIYFLGLRTLGPFTMFKALPYFYSLYLEVQTFLMQLEPPPILEHPLSFREFPHLYYGLWCLAGSHSQL